MNLNSQMHIQQIYTIRYSFFARGSYSIDEPWRKLIIGAQLRLASYFGEQLNVLGSTKY